MKVSLIITVLNEEKTISRLLDSLAKQTKKPDEIVIVDGGSTDRTLVKLQSCKATKRQRKFKILIRPGVTIAQGRNIGIKVAKSPIIVMTDAGCVAYSDWLEKLIQPFRTLRVRNAIGIDVVAGFYRMTGKSVFQRCLACYLGVLPEKLNPKTFLPSTRSMAFRKEIWEKIGGFDENLKKTGEDTLFNYRAKKLGAKFVTLPDALVDWEMPGTGKEAVGKFYWYAFGDAQAGIWWDPEKRLVTHNLKIAVIFIRYLLGLLLLIWLFVIRHSLFSISLYLYISISLYFFWSIFKNYRYVRRWQAIFVLPALQIVSDLAVMAGFISGIMRI